MAVDAALHLRKLAVVGEAKLVCVCVYAWVGRRNVCVAAEGSSG